MIVHGNNIILENGRIIENLGVYSVQGLLLWHDSSNLLSEGTKIATIIDKVGSGFSLIQSDVKRQPTYRENVINSYGAASYELNTVDFPIGSQGSVMGSRTGSQNYFNGRVVEFFWVARFLNLPTSNPSLFYHLRTNGGGVIVNFRLFSNGRFSLSAIDDLSNTITTTLPITLNTNQWYLFYGLVDFSGTFNRTISVDGVGTISDTSTNSFTFTANHNFRFGGSANTAVIQCPESIITSNTTPLNNNDKTIINNYLKNKYNI